jgi:peroxiredoxin
MVVAWSNGAESTLRAPPRKSGLAMVPSSAASNGSLAPLPVGTPAPEFALPQAPHSKLTLRRLGARPIVLAFYPMDWEPVSREQLTLYQSHADAIGRLGACLLGISIDHVHSHAAFARDAQLRFPLLADFQPRGLVARRYGVFRETQGVSARALFVFDAQRVIRFSKAYPDQLNPGVDELLTTLETLAARGPPLPRAPHD